MSSTLPRPTVATLSPPMCALASFSKSAQVLKRLSCLTNKKDGCDIMRATGVISSRLRMMLGAGNHVGNDIEIVAGKRATQAPKTGNHFIEDQQQPVFVTNLA